MSGEFHREYLVRLPLPLAQLYGRAHNSPSARARHDNSFYLFEALIKLSATPLIATYLSEIDAGLPRNPALDRLLAQLALPSLGQWVGILRETAKHFGTRSDAPSHPLGHVWGQLRAKHRAPSAMLALFKRIKNGPDGQLAGDESCAILDLFDALVLYRNTVFGHGAGRTEAFYDQEMGPLLFPAASDMLAEDVLDLLGPHGSRLVHIGELRSIDDRRVDVALSELVGLQSERMASLELTPEEAAGLSGNCVAVLWPGRKAPLRLDPLLVFRGAEFADEVRFLNRDRSGKQVEYLSYTTGRTERDQSMSPVMARLLSRVTGREVSEQELDRLAQQSMAETAAVDALLAPVPLASRTVGDFEILAELGRGGMGVVYLARQLSLGRLVALKMLPASLAGDEVALARFRREMRALGRCEHPNIVKVLSSGTLPDGQIFYAMEYVPGADLEMVWRELSGLKRIGETSSLGGTTLSQAVLTASRKNRDEMERRQAGASSPTDFGHRGADTEVEPSRRPASEPAPPDSAPAAHPLSLPTLPELPAAEQDPGGYMRRVARLMRDAALAVQAVHDQNIVHRDIKPANLMLTPDGSRVVLMDFGLAKGQSLALTKTMSGEFLGTLRYAAPEQLAAAKVKIDFRVDVRALGVTLWELITRQQAYGDAEDQSQLAAWVLSRDLPPLRSIDPTIDADLEAIVARATERDPDRRIQTARELAEYLEMYLEGQPLPIRLPSAMELMGRWVREHRPLVAVGAASFAAVVITVIVAFFSILASRHNAIVARNDAVDARNDAVTARNSAVTLAERNKQLADEESQARRREEIARKDAEAATQREAVERRRADAKAAEAEANFKQAQQQRVRADAAAQEALRSAAQATREKRMAEHRLYAASMNLAQLALDGGQSARMQDLLARYASPAPGQEDLRGWEWYYLRSLSGQQLRTIEGNENEVQSVAVSPDGSLIASAVNAEFKPVMPFGPKAAPVVLRKGSIRLWDARTGAALKTLGVHETVIRRLVFTPDGKRLIASDPDRLHIWDVATGQEVPTKYEGPAREIALRSDGEQLATISGENVRIWDLKKDAEVKKFPVVPPPLKRQFFGVNMAWSPDGKRLVTVLDLQPDFEAMQVRDPKTFRGFSHMKPDHLATVWNPETAEPLTQIWGAGDYVAMSPDGERFVTGYTSEISIVPSKVRVWDMKTGKAVIEPTESAGPTFQSAAYAPDGKTFCVTAGNNIQIYDAVTGKVTSTLRGHKATVMSLVFSRDGRMLVSGANDKLVKIWTMTHADEYTVLDAAGGGVAIHRGRGLIVTTGDRRLKIWDLATRKQTRDIPLSFSSYYRLVFSPDGKQLAASTGHNTTDILSVDEGKVVRVPEGQTEGSSSGSHGGAVWSPDGRWLAAPLLNLNQPAAVGDPVKVWNAATGKGIFLIPNATAVDCALDGRRVVTGGRSEPLAVWDVIAGRNIFSKPFRGKGPWLEGPLSVAFSPDGKTVAGGFYNGRIYIWDAATGEQIVSMEGHANEVNALAFTPDGKRLISASDDTTLKLWDVSTGMEIFTLRGHTRGVWDVRISDDGRWLVSTGGGGVHIRDIGAPLFSP